MNGVCACGCGQATAIAARTTTSRGVIKGQPMKWVFGHWMKRPARGTCSLDGCERPIRSNGLCSKHYYRANAHGDPLAPIQEKDPAGKLAWLQALAAQEPTGECVDWPWSLRSTGYGQFRLEGKNRCVPHLSLEFSGRPRPAAPNNQSLHSCDRRICVAPWHLRWGNQSENMQDAWARTRRHDTAVQS